MDNATWENIELISSMFNVSSDLISVTIFLILTSLIMVLVFVYTRGSILTVLTSWVFIGAGTMLGFIPGWIFVPVFSLGLLFLWGSTGTEEDSAGSTPYWEQYGENLKSAYSAKFGGTNPGFDDEVSKRIAIMVHSKNGFTRTIAKDWLSRMNKFTEAKQ